MLVPTPCQALPPLVDLCRPIVKRLSALPLEAGASESCHLTPRPSNITRGIALIERYSIRESGLRGSRTPDPPKRGGFTDRCDVADSRHQPMCRMNGAAPRAECPCSDPVFSALVSAVHRASAWGPTRTSGRLSGTSGAQIVCPPSLSRTGKLSTLAGPHTGPYPSVGELGSVSAVSILSCEFAIGVQGIEPWP